MYLHVFSYYSYSGLLVLFMEVPFCGCSYEVEIPKLEAVWNFSQAKLVLASVSGCSYCACRPPVPNGMTCLKRTEPFLMFLVTVVLLLP